MTQFTAVPCCIDTCDMHVASIYVYIIITAAASRKRIGNMHILTSNLWVTDHSFWVSFQWVVKTHCSWNCSALPSFTSLVVADELHRAKRFKLAFTVCPWLISNLLCCRHSTIVIVPIPRGSHIWLISSPLTPTPAPLSGWTGNVVRQLCMYELCMYV